MNWIIFDVLFIFTQYALNPQNLKIDSVLVTRICNNLFSYLS